MADPHPPRPYRYRKRLSLSRLSSDTTGSLPPYRPPPPHTAPVLETEAFEQAPPPDYPNTDSADEADEEADFDSERFRLPVVPPLANQFSPRRRRLLRSVSSQQQGRQEGFYASKVSQSDIYLDKILERSVAALELSNTLLQSSASTKSALATVLGSPDANTAQEDMLDSSARMLTDRISAPRHERWMDDLDGLARDVTALLGEGGGEESDFADMSARRAMPMTVARAPSAVSASDGGGSSRSLPSSSAVPPRRYARHSAGGARTNGNGSTSSYPVSVSVSEPSASPCVGAGRLRLSSPEQQRIHSPPPRPRTQYISASAALGSDVSPSFASFDLASGCSDPSSSAQHVMSDAGAGPGLAPFSPPPPSPKPSAYASLVLHAARSPSATRSSPTASRSSSRTPTYRQRSSSRSSTSGQPPSPLLPRLIPPPIEELPSQSDSSTSESPHPFRTMESLRKILDEQALEDKEKMKDEKGKSPERPVFLPRSPPVTPSLKASTTTTSISRLFTKGAHSTTTRPPTPPKHSSLKRRVPPPSLQTDEHGALVVAPSASGTPLSTTSTSNSVADFLSPNAAVSMSTSTSTSSRISSGRSTPLRVAFGPLPEPHSSASARDGAPSRFQEQRAAKARRKKRGSSSSSGLGADGGDDSSTSRGGGGSNESGRRSGGQGHARDSASESSWWTTWLTGGSVLSMSASRAEERAEDRIARAWGRPGPGGALEDWPV